MFPKVWRLCADEAGIEARRKEKKHETLGVKSSLQPLEGVHLWLKS
jgi:hypothetical protein